MKLVNFTKEFFSLTTGSFSLNSFDRNNEPYRDDSCCETSHKFYIKDFKKDISFDDFMNEIQSSFPDEFFNGDFIDEPLTIFLYTHYFGNCEKTFSTGESLSIDICSFIKDESSTDKSKKNCKIVNLMLKDYPVQFENSFDEINTDWHLFISEISKQNDGTHKLELVMTCNYSERYFLAGRFKFFVRLGDVIKLKYYSHPLCEINAEVISLDYNSITFRFFAGSL